MPAPKLHVKLSESYNGLFEFTLVGKASPNSDFKELRPDLTFRGTAVLNRHFDGQGCVVYEGQLECPEAAGVQSYEVVCKIASEGGSEFMQRLEREARFYSHELKGLQDVSVPRFYGLYRSTVTIKGEGEEREVTCILLKHGGRPVSELECTESNMPIR